MKLIAINPPSTITEPQIPNEIARDSEVTAAISAHVAAADPHPGYLTQHEGDGRYRQTATALTDADIPAAIARDSEVAAEIASHVSAANPHSQYLGKTEKAVDAELIDGINSDRLVAGGDWSRALGDLNIDSVISSNSGFFDCWNAHGGTFPAGFGHFHGFQSRHRNNSSIWGMQVGAQYNANELFFRTISSGSWNPWRRTWHEGNFNPASHAQYFNGTTAKSIGYSGGNFFSETNNCGYEIQARDSSSAAYLSFHRPGIFACHVGLDTDNQLKIGGWSFGGASYKIWNEWNLPRPPSYVIKTFNSGLTQGSMTSMVHRQSLDQILSYDAFIRIDLSNSAGFIPMVKPGGLLGIPGYNFSLHIDTANIICRLHPTDSGNILNKLIKVCFLT